MLRIDPSIALDVELNGNGAGKHAFQAGDPQTGREATQVPFQWLNAVQETLCRAIEDGLGPLDANNPLQLLELIKAVSWGVGKTSAPWAPLESPALTGMPTAPTAAPGTSTTQIANTAYVNAARPFESTLANIKMDGAQSVGSLFQSTAARGG